VSLLAGWLESCPAIISPGIVSYLDQVLMATSESSGMKYLQPKNKVDLKYQPDSNHVKLLMIYRDTLMELL
jgi:hypothetical protein